ncbi:MAG: hypothetical protein JWN40_5886 [Phycisphaerales bacterium]|nr:hypothetical protein [Phycisphaerales bacterium]
MGNWNKAKGRLLAVALAAIPAAGARASVTLIFDDGLGLPGKTDVGIAPGSSFTVSVYLNSTIEQTTGLSYYLSAPGAGAGHFRITNRGLTNAAYTVPTPDNIAVLNSANSLLNPQNLVDLGGGLTQAQSTAGFFYGTGPWLSAIYTIQVLPGTFAGDYLIKTVSDANTGWTGSQNDMPIPFSDHAFANQGTTAYTVTVTPEPGSLALLALGGMALGMRRGS